MSNCNNKCTDQTERVNLSNIEAKFTDVNNVFSCKTLRTPSRVKSIVANLYKYTRKMRISINASTFAGMP